MGTVDGITYGERIWRSDPDAAFAEADRRVAMVREDPGRKRLVLSDLYALTRLPPDLATCGRLEAILIGDATGPDDEDYSHSGTRMLDDWSPLLDLTGLKDLGLSWSNFSQWNWLAGLHALEHLDCRGTQITSLEGLAGLPALQNLDCSETQITSLEVLARLPALQHLDCTLTQIDSLAPLAGLSALQHLTCAGTRIASLAPLAGLSALQHLSCAHTQITSLEVLARLPALQHLDCTLTQIASLAPLAGLSALQHLTCAGTQITSLEPLAGLTGLQELDCAGTQITSLVVLAGLTGLQELYCAGTQITSLEPLVGLTGLQELDCAGTQITSLEPLAGLTGLQELDCAGTQITSLEPLVGLTGLQELDCARTQITSLEPLAGLTGLQELYCAGTQITSLEPLVGLTGLQELDCARTQITSLEPLAGLTGLQELDCAGTQITSLEPLAGLTGLQELNCSSTKIASLAGLEGSTKLIALYCGFTDITSLAGLAPLKHLEELYCPSTPVTSLDGLSALHDLKELTCADTRITTLEEVASLENLSTLNIRGCKLDNDPDFLRSFPKLEILRAEGASIPGIPAEALIDDFSEEGCLDQLRAHLTDLGPDPVWLCDIKLIVLGNGRIGKTQICNRLRDKAFIENDKSTHGILISNADIPNQDEGSFRVWDFGGQDIYLGTHALFLKSRAVFLLVWTPETDTHAEYEHEGLTFRNQPVAWWLDYLRRFADTEAPWIICQTRIDEAPDRGEHPQIPAIRESAADVTTVAYSAKTQAREGLFFGALSDAARAVNPPKIGRGRLRVIEDLRRLFDEDRKREKEDRTRLLSRARFDEICAEVGGISDTGHFLDFLHRSGEVFWQDGLFGGDIVLDQPWMLEAIYAVFDRSGALQTLRLTGGRFTRADMGRLVWDVDGYSVEEQEQFIRFMGTCQIAFRLSDDYVEPDKAVYLAPDLLPETWGLRDAIDPRDPVARSFRFEALPPALMRHVQSRLGKAARDSATYWRNGFYGFDTGSGTHLMFEQILGTDWSGTITVTAWGREARRLSETGTAILEEEARSLGLASDDRSEHAEPEQVNEHEPDWGRDPEAPETLAVSYARKDETDPDRERIVDGICAKAETAGWKVFRDKTSMTTGDRISEFIEAIGQATRVLVVLTEKYTRSRFCMSELRLLWLKAGGDERVLREKVRVYSDDVVLRWNDLDRADVVSHWEKWVAERKSRQRQMAVSDIQTFRNLEAFCYDAAEILHMFSDTLQPRSLSELADYALD